MTLAGLMARRRGIVAVLSRLNREIERRLYPPGKCVCATGRTVCDVHGRGLTLAQRVENGRECGWPEVGE